MFLYQLGDPTVGPLRVGTVNIRPNRKFFLLESLGRYTQGLGHMTCRRVSRLCFRDMNKLFNGEQEWKIVWSRFLRCAVFCIVTVTRDHRHTADETNMGL